MSSSDKNFVRNLCFAAGLFFAFLLLAPIKFGPPTPEPPAQQVEATTATAAASVDNVPTNLDTASVSEDSVSPPAEYLDVS